jgi:glucosyl-dolichyl phosphate glucuronosyltransferase
MSVVISIVICTRNRAASLRETLAALSRVAVPGDITAEILVVDDASTDDTRIVVGAAQSKQSKKMCVRYIFEPQIGQSHARNRGLLEANGELILFTDDDVRPPVDWIESMCRPLLGGAADAVAGEIEPHPSLERPWLRGFLRTLVACTRHEPRIDLVGANMAFTRSAVERLGGFDVELGPGALGQGDDTLFSYQVEASGMRLHRATDVQVEHHFDAARLEPKMFLKGAAAAGRSMAYITYHWKHEKVESPLWLYSSFTTRLFLRRLMTPGRWRNGVPPWEVTYVRAASFYGQYLRCCRVQRNYSKHGLRKINGHYKSPLHSIGEYGHDDGGGKHLKHKRAS